jgi:hypothetical protein
VPLELREALTWTVNAIVPWELIPHFNGLIELTAGKIKANRTTACRFQRCAERVLRSINVKLGLTPIRRPPGSLITPGIIRLARNIRRHIKQRDRLMVRLRSASAYK